MPWGWGRGWRGYGRRGWGGWNRGWDPVVDVPIVVQGAPQPAPAPQSDPQQQQQQMLMLGSLGLAGLAMVLYVQNQRRQ